MSSIDIMTQLCEALVGHRVKVMGFNYKTFLSHIDVGDKDVMTNIQEIDY